jgi:Tetratricopeptide repeat
VTLFVMDRLPAAVRTGRAAVEMREAGGEPVALAGALVALAAVYWAMTEPPEALATAARAVRLLEPGGDSVTLVWSLNYHGMLLTAVDRYAEALPVGEAAVAMAGWLAVTEQLALAQVLRAGRVSSSGMRRGSTRCCWESAPRRRSATTSTFSWATSP